MEGQTISIVFFFRFCCTQSGDFSLLLSTRNTFLVHFSLFIQNVSVNRGACSVVSPWLYGRSPKSRLFQFQVRLRSSSLRLLFHPALLALSAGFLGCSASSILLQTMIFLLKKIRACALTTSVDYVADAFSSSMEIKYENKLRACVPESRHVGVLSLLTQLGSQQCMQTHVHLMTKNRSNEPCLINKSYKGGGGTC